MLLNFEVENYGSFKDRVSLTMSAPVRTDAEVREVPLAPQTTVAAVLYGPNGSGKTTLLDAIAGLVHAARFSHNRWEPGQPTSARPFLLQQQAEETPSAWLLEIAAQDAEGTPGVFRYQAVMTPLSVVEEGLEFKSSRTGRFRTLFRRRGQTVHSSNAALRSLQPRLRENALLLSLAAQENDPMTRPVFAQLVERTLLVRNADHPEAHRRRLNHLVRETDLGLVAALARRADVGIGEVRGKRLTDEDRERLRQLDRRLADVLPGLSLALPTGEFSDLEFAHVGPDGRQYWLSEDQESDGTSAFLTVGLYAQRALAVGGVLVIDELDRSLHPSLVDALVEDFRSPLTNPHGAQIIATSHGTHLFGRNTLRPLSRHEVWFTEKTACGVSSLFRLSDFPDVRPAVDQEHRYLAGRYGAVPFVRPLSGDAVVGG